MKISMSPVILSKARSNERGQSKDPMSPGSSCHSDTLFPPHETLQIGLLAGLVSAADNGVLRHDWPTAAPLARPAQAPVRSARVPQRREGNSHLDDSYNDDRPSVD